MFTFGAETHQNTQEEAEEEEKKTKKNTSEIIRCPTPEVSGPLPNFSRQKPPSRRHLTPPPSPTSNVKM